MINKILSILTIVMALALKASAMPSFNTKLHARIAKEVKIDIPDNIGIEANNDSTWSFRGRTLRIRTNAFGDVSHIGYKMFDNSIVDAYGNTPLLNFIERYILELDLCLDGRTAADRMDIDRVFCGKGNIGMFRKVTPTTPFEIEVVTRRMYRAKWFIGDEELSLTIPADCQLLLGANAIELEDMFEAGVKRIIPISGDALIPEWANAKTSRSENFIVANSGEYLSSLIRSDIYLKKEKGKPVLVLDAKNPQHSIRNIMLTGAYSKDIPMNLKIDRYGHKATKAGITLQQFVSFCKLDGCKLYFGVKQRDNKVLKGTLFAVNMPLAYNHVLSVEFPIDILNGKEETVSGTVYTYIPLHNVTDEFFIQDLTK